MRIGEAAQKLGCSTHLLRHWEDVGVLVPNRTASGHRDYREHHLDTAKLIHLCQHAGLSLDEITHLMSQNRDTQAELISAKRAALTTRIETLISAEHFLQHIGECVHPVVSDCPECRSFASTSPVRNVMTRNT
jgi:MerR family copper efflux transcriptional regulator